jgi:hypothetical protein
VLVITSALLASMGLAGFVSRDVPKSGSIRSLFVALFALWVGGTWSADARRLVSRVLTVTLAASAARELIRGQRSTSADRMGFVRRNAAKLSAALAVGNAIAGWWPRPFDAE